jgi:GH18 family chitinase
MRKPLYLLLFLLQYLPVFLNAQPCREVIGYYPGWQWYDRNKLVRPATIKYEKYTIINYAFFKPNANGTIVGADPWADENILKGQINWSTTPPSHYRGTSLVDLAHGNNVKVLISVGGWTFSDDFPAIAANAAKRAIFAGECKRLINEYNLDGIDIDWEYPGYAPHNGTTADKQNFTFFLQNIRDTLNVLQVQTGKNYLLTACVGASQTHMNNVDWAAVTPILDKINVMSYDFFGTWDSVTNHNAPLSVPAQGDPTFNLTSATNTLLTTHNVPPNKITMGTAFYGRSAKTVNTPNLHVAQTGQSDNVTFAADDGSPLYYNVLLKQNLFTTQYDSLAQVPYLTGNGTLKTFVSYDNPAAIALKAQFIKDKNLAGAIIWEITGDYVETAVGSGVIASTPLADALNTTFCNNAVVCNPPTAVTSSVNNNVAIISWTGGANSYEVQYKTSTATAWTIVPNITTTTYTINNLFNCTTYQVRLKANCTTISSALTTPISFTTVGCSNGGGGNGTGIASTCTSPTSFYFTANNFIPMGEIKIGQGRLHPIWGVSVDAHVPSNRLSWAISMAHGAHLFRNVVGTNKIPANFYFATAAKESFCGCDNGITAMPTGTNFPFTFQAASLGDGCFQIENNSAYNELVNMYPQRFPAGQHANLIGNANFETAALSKAYYDIFTVKYWDIHKGWNALGFFNNATDPNAAIKLMAVAYNRGLWYTPLGTVLSTDRNNAIVAPSISNYFIGNTYGYDYQNALTTYTRVLENEANTLPATATAINPQTNLPYNYFDNFYNPQVNWADIDLYINKLQPLYPTVNITTVKNAVQATFNNINNGGAISFRYQLGTVLNTLMLQLPADDPSANIATTYGCATPNNGGGNTPPVVTVTNPVNNATFTAPANITLSATASDPNGTIAKVEFYQGATLLTTVTTAPYSYILPTPLAAGSYIFTAKAFDNQGASTVSAAVNITVNGGTIPCNAPIYSSGNGSYQVGTQVVNNGALYACTVAGWCNSNAAWAYAPGTGSAWQQAWNLVGNCNNTPPTNQPPTVSITSPQNNAIFTSPATFTITATAADADGTVTKVEFYQNNVLIGTDNAAPFSWNIASLAAGNYAFTAKAFDNVNASTVSSVVNVVVNTPTNQPPTVSITSPQNNAIFTSPATFTITATAADADGTVTKVEFYQNNVLIGTDNVAPFTWNIVNLVAGNYAFTAKAFDNANASTVSSTVSSVVNTPTNQPPTVSIMSPQNNAIFTSPATFTITATAADADGTVTKVEFYQNNVLIGTDNAAPFSWNIASLAAGNYAFTAKAFDNVNASTVSSVVNVVVNAPTGGGGCVGIPTYNPAGGANYGQGTQVQNVGNLYSCTVPGWCNGVASAYAPGTGWAWQQAWSLVGSCGANSNLPPTVSVSVPNGTWTMPATILLSATAADVDGTIAKVEFYEGSNLLGTDFTAPYNFTWTAQISGVYNVTAKAYDNANASTISSVVKVTVLHNGSACNAAAWTATAVYTAGMKTQHNNKLWQAQWWTQGDTPGVVLANGSTPWVNLGTCTTILDRVSKSFKASIFPNPTNSEITLQVENIQKGATRLYMTDVMGRVVLEEKWDVEENNFYKTFDISHLQNGIYNLFLANEVLKINKTLVKVE